MLQVVQVWGTRKALWDIYQFGFNWNIVSERGLTSCDLLSLTSLKVLWRASSSCIPVRHPSPTSRVRHFDIAQQDI